MEKVPKSKQKKVHALHQKTKVFRTEDPYISVLMWGVDHTINVISGVPERALIMGADFKAYSKVGISNHNYNDTELPSKFKVKEYCPIVFRDLRNRFNEDPDDYRSSLSDEPPVDEASAGRSGARFYKSADKRLVVKTLSGEDVASFHNSFPAYHAFVVEQHGTTLLPQYLGLYRITVGEKEMYTVVMRNVFSTELEVNRIYDLKGSTVDRSANDKELAKELPVLKDNDFKKNQEKIVIGAEARTVLLDKLRRDVEFLCKNKFMDYSLLVGIHDCKDDDPEIDFEEDRFAIRSTGPVKQIYFIGIIDVLTKYGAKKIAAHTAKGMKHGPNAQISTVNPEQYMQRFLEFIESVVE